MVDWLEKGPANILSFFENNRDFEIKFVDG